MEYVFYMNTKISILLYSLLHFLVDGICSLVIWSRLYNGVSLQSSILFITYNVLAFCTQPLFGLLIYKYNNKNRLLLIISIFLLILGVLFSFQYIISAILLGIGNSIFHITGGKFVICKTNNDIVSLGIFVAPGALGLVIGKYIISLVTWIIFLSLLIIFTVLLMIFNKNEELVCERKNIVLSNKIMKSIVLVIILVVLLRSFVGSSNIFTFDKNITILILMGAFTMIGKILGGILSKYFGINITIISTMIISLICFIFFNNNLYVALLGILLFNCSMPITLCLMNELFPKLEGFSFGLLAAFLIPGYLLGTFNYGENLLKVLIIISCILSIILVMLSNAVIKRRSGVYLWKY